MELISHALKMEIAETLKKVLKEHDSEKEKKENLKSLTIYQVAKQLGRAHATVKKYVAQGLLKTTKDGRIPEVELERFLNDQ